MLTTRQKMEHPWPSTLHEVKMWLERFIKIRVTGRKEKIHESGSVLMEKCKTVQQKSQNSEEKVNFKWYRWPSSKWGSFYGLKRMLWKISTLRIVTIYICSMRIKCDLPFHIVKIILDMDIASLCLTFPFHCEPQFLLYNIKKMTVVMPRCISWLHCYLVILVVWHRTD